MGQSKEERNQSKFSLQDPKIERKERFLSTQLISQENPTIEINRFEGNGLEWLVPGGTPFAFGRGQDLRGREGNNLLVHACRTNSLFFLFPFLFPFFLLSFISFLFPCFLFCDPSQVVVIVVLAFFSLLFLLFLLSFVHDKGLLLQCLLWPDFTVLAFNHLCLFWVYLPTTTGPFVCHSPSPDKEDYFVCQFAVAPLPAIVWFLSPCPSWHAPSSSISALPVWVVCHPNRTLPPKEPWQEPQNLPSLHHQTIPSYL